MLEQYYSINQAAGISLVFRQDGSLQVDACSITVDRKQLDFEKKLSGLNTLQDLAKQLPEKTLLSVNLSGRGILQKQVERIAEINPQNFGRVVPNAVFDDFYIQNFISGEFSYVSLIRKTEADKWIGQLKELGFVPLTLSLGPFPVQHIIGQLNVYDHELIFNGHIIIRNEQSEWASCTHNETARSPFPIKIESESISEQLVIPYAAVFQLVLASKVDPIQVNVPELENALKEIIAGKKLKVQGALILAVFFVLLLVNFLLFSWLNTDNNRLSGQLSMTNQSNINIEGVSEQVKEKEMLLRNLGWEGGINKSALVDQLASLLPADLTWTEVAVDPIDQASSRIQKSLVFFSRQIRVSGTSAKIIPVNEWIARVKTKSWVKNIQLDSYTFNNELNTGQFTIVINY